MTAGFLPQRRTPGPINSPRILARHRIGILDRRDLQRPGPDRCPAATVPPVALSGSWIQAAVVNGERVCLEPLRVEQADELAPVLDDPLLHTFIGGEPADVDQLRARYRRQVVGRSADGAQRWLNWLVRRRKDAQALGTVQATVSETEDELTAEVAWMIGTAHQGQGYARQAAALMARWLRNQGVDTLIAHVHPQHDASMAVARAIGLAPTATIIEGEVRWQA